MRLIGVSVLQSAASAVLAPSLKHASDSLALAWRRRLTRIAHGQYLHGNNFYSLSQLAGMQVRCRSFGSSHCVTSSISASMLAAHGKRQAKLAMIPFREQS